MKVSPAQASQRLKKQQAKAKLVALIADGWAVNKALVEVGRTKDTYMLWRSEDPEFARRITGLRLRNKDPNLDGLGFVEFRQLYFGRDTAAHHYEIIEAIERAEPDSITMVLAFPEAAKGLALDTPLPTPTGWTTQGDVDVGDWLLDDQGNPCRVMAVSEDHHRPCYALSFTGGERIIADDEHLWLARTMSAGRYNARVVSTTYLAERPVAYGRANHAVPMTRPLSLPDVDFTIDPYVLGVWLGDGTASAGTISAGDDDAEEMAGLLRDCGENVCAVRYPSGRCWTIRLAATPGLCPRGHERRPGVASCAECSAQHYRWHTYGEPMSPYTHSSLQARLRLAGLLDNKHVPPAYLRASAKQRLALLQGLMDTDGSADIRGRCSFASVSDEIAEGFGELLDSLGMKYSHRLGRLPLGGVVHRFSFVSRADLPPFRLARKAARCRPDPPNDRRNWRMIRNVEPHPTVTTRCIAVDSPSRLYLAGRSMIPTHNTSVMVDYVNYKLGPIDPNYRIVSITEGQDLARKIVSQVTTRMTDEQSFSAYIERFGPFKAPDRSHAKPWNADYVCLLQSHRDEKEPNLEAKGWGSKIYGGRYDLVWTDDVQSSETLNQTPQLLRYLRQTVLTRPAKGVGRTVMTGSRVGTGDIYETMIDEGMVDNLVTIPALTRWLPREEHFVKVGSQVTLVPDCPEISSWPEYWSMLDLAKRRAKVGEEIWARTYMQRAVFECAATFSAEMVDKAKDPARGLGRSGVGTDVIISVDPALDTGVCAFLVCAYSSTKLWVLDAIERRDIYRGEDILVQLANLAATYRPGVVVIEENNFQKSLARDSRLEELSARFGFQVLGHKTYRNKSDPVMGVAMMASAFCDGEVSIPWAEDARGPMGLLCDELRAWRPLKRGTQLKQDLVMCLWFTWIAWEERRGSMGAPVTQLWRPSWMRRVS